MSFTHKHWYTYFVFPSNIILSMNYHNELSSQSQDKEKIEDKSIQ